MQLELQINRLSNANLLKKGYKLPSMSPQQEHRFGRLMEKAAKADKIHSGPDKGLPKGARSSSIELALSKAAPNRDAALKHIAKAGKVTTKEFALIMGWPSKKAGTLLANLRKRKYVSTNEIRVVTGGGMPYVYRLTKHGKALLRAVYEREDGKK